MKQLAISLLSVSLLSGCAIFSKTATTEQKAAEIQSLCQAAASIGTQVALNEKPQFRPQFEVAYTNLDMLVTSKTINGALLRNIIASLPVKELKSPNAQIAIEAATVLYDTTVGSKVNIEAQPYVVAAATGIRDGLKAALGK